MTDGETQQVMPQNCLHKDTKMVPSWNESDRRLYRTARIIMQNTRNLISRNPAQRSLLRTNSNNSPRLFTF